MVHGCYTHSKKDQAQYALCVTGVSVSSNALLLVCYAQYLSFDAQMRDLCVMVTYTYFQQLRQLKQVRKQSSASKIMFV